MTTSGLTPAVRCALHESGWARIRTPRGDRWVTRLPLVDIGTGRFAHTTHRVAREVARREGARLVHPETYRAIVAAGFRVEPVILPTPDMCPPRLPGESERAYQTRIRQPMASAEWCRIHDERVFAQLRAWDGSRPVYNIGKPHMDGAPPGRMYLAGWVMKDGRWVQPPSPPGAPGPHDDGHGDYSSTVVLETDLVEGAGPPEGGGPPGLGSMLLDAGRRLVSAAVGVITKAPLFGATQQKNTTNGDHMPSQRDLYPFVRAKHYRVGRIAPVRLIVLHTAEVPETATSAEAVASYFRNPIGPRGPVTASAHFCVDNNSVVQCVAEVDTAFAAPGANHDGIQIEMSGRAAQTAAEWDDAYSRELLERTAALVAELCERHDVPAVYVDEAGLLSGERGITTHAAVSKAWKKSTHTDPGKSFPMGKFLEAVAGYMAPEDIYEGAG